MLHLIASSSGPEKILLKRSINLLHSWTGHNDVDQIIMEDHLKGEQLQQSLSIFCSAIEPQQLKSMSMTFCPFSFDFVLQLLGRAVRNVSFCGSLHEAASQFEKGVMRL